MGSQGRFGPQDIWLSGKAMCRRTFECLNVSNLSAGIVSLSCFVHVRNYPAWSVGLLSLICWLLCFCFHSRPLFCSSRSSTWKVFWDFPQPEEDRIGQDWWPHWVGKLRTLQNHLFRILKTFSANMLRMIPYPTPYHTMRTEPSIYLQVLNARQRELYNFHS